MHIMALVSDMAFNTIAHKFKLLDGFECNFSCIICYIELYCASKDKKIVARQVACAVERMGFFISCKHSFSMFSFFRHEIPNDGEQ